MGDVCMVCKQLRLGGGGCCSGPGTKKIKAFVSLLCISTFFPLAVMMPFRFRHTALFFF